MSLTDVTIRNLPRPERQRKLADEKGLYLLLYPNGSKYWRLKYRFLDKEKAFALGVCPKVSLKRVGELRDDARRLLAAGIDPNAAKVEARNRASELAANSFEAVAKEWIKRKLDKKSPGYRDKVVSRLERLVDPWLGKRPIASVTAPEILNLVQRIEDRGIVETAHRTLQVIGQIFRYAIAAGLTQGDPTPALRSALMPVEVKHMAAPTNSPEDAGAILRFFDAFRGGMSCSAQSGCYHWCCVCSPHGVTDDAVGTCRRSRTRLAVHAGKALFGRGQERAHRSAFPTSGRDLGGDAGAIGSSCGRMGVPWRSQPHASNERWPRLFEHDPG
ncbi:MAG: integrase arm-type DNA-binding domain-containing protein [Proteobacteria bacterium]|nr:integrase arm-type DNA-binding domain-containing protein [Pseudomonadota bacterium]